MSPTIACFQENHPNCSITKVKRIVEINYFDGQKLNHERTSFGYLKLVMLGNSVIITFIRLIISSITCIWQLKMPHQSRDSTAIKYIICKILWWKRSSNERKTLDSVTEHAQIKAVNNEKTQMYRFPRVQIGCKLLS